VNIIRITIVVRELSMQALTVPSCPCLTCRSTGFNVLRTLKPVN
jgi:hypothetical protein